ncbi:16S rRNA (cytosine(967)-C(5))-methyltransferase RsmB [Alicyclobacillus ferrooxydans]|uniref:16S rRNA (cytosine(967)-C(5))-methyltransferase n=1 Tax=Alicyclobacillus ferrooxydans TaxID=471514 RepID=A0A0P9F1U7_9BACL|nr:16S rRNA (cytosine(967)-C(5))-methyltransferase RsmB [Alicyclobacillus ferrooxydans]KPV45347.1 hypothetical protein AN477_03075 [Alicyclobacillus ferrooxydans]
MTAVARASAFRILCDITEHGKYSNVALLQHYRKTALDERDKALCTEIVYGTLQYQKSIDALLEPLCKRGLAGIEERVLVILRMSVYQLGYLSRVPQYAVLSDAVDICKGEVRKAAGFVNGVLRSFTRDKRSVADKLKERAGQQSDFVGQTAMVYSYPEWFVRALFEQFGEERTVAILEAGNERSQVALRVNATKLTRDAFIENSSNGSEDAPRASVVSPVGVRLSKGLDVERWDAYQTGLVTVQDEASMLIAPLLGLEGDEKVLDLCAGLGTKTTQLLELQGGTGHVTAVDIHFHKLELLRQSAQRLGLTGVKTVVADARSFRTNSRYRNAFDAVLLDAPCSGMGVLRRRPEIRWRRTFEESRSLSALQEELLEAALAAVRPGGVVVYSTCTLLKNENEDVVRAVVARHGDTVMYEDVTAWLPEGVSTRLKLADTQAATEQAALENGAAEKASTEKAAAPLRTDIGVTITPELFDTDGFYMARLRKRDS